MPENSSCSPLDRKNSDPSTLSDAQLRAIKIQNMQKSINKLPPELLSRIFRLGEEEERYTRSRNFTYRGLQDLATQVCSHWRSVAIRDSSLWTYIHITRPPPHELAYLYLKRAGPTTLLDIDIEIRSRYWDNEPCTSYIEDRRISHIETMIAMLSGDGADVHRWRSLSVCVKRPDPLIKFVQFLEQRSAPALRCISFKWKIGPHSPGEKREKDITTLFRSILREDSHSRLSKRSVPNLRCIELTHVPWDFFSSPSLLPYTGLTSLSLTAAYTILNTSQLCNLLSLNPLLESLSLGTGFSHITDVPPTESVSLPALRSFSISTWEAASWVLGMLKIINAPILHSFSVSTIIRSDEGGNGLIANYLATGRSLDGLVAGPSTPIQLYPSLRQLDIASFNCTQDEIASIFVSFPSITHLCALGKQAELLDAPRLLLPELVCLKFLHVVCSDLGSMLHRRAKAGHPIKNVVLPHDWGMKLGAEIPGSVHVKLYSETIAEANSYESEGEEYYSSDEDENFGYDPRGCDEQYWDNESGEYSDGSE